jgi:TrmH family RNA methyltransferase
VSSEQTWRGVVVAIRRTATPRGRAAEGRCWIEGTRVLERALEAGAQIEAAVLSAGYRDDSSVRVQTLLSGLESAGCSLHVAPDEVIAELMEGRGTGAIVALARVPEEPGLDAVLETTRIAPAGGPPVLLVAHEVDDPGNLGALVRTAHASGAAAFVGVGPSDPFHPVGVRTSMGSVFRVPVLRRARTPELLEELSAHGIRTVGAVARGGTPLPAAGLGRESTAILLGSEAFGLPEEVTLGLDARVSIPMPDDVSSFSVNAAAAILLYEARRAQLGSGLLG